MARNTLGVVENDKPAVVGTMEMGGNIRVMVEVEEVIDELQEKFCE